jgi:hypothetical protein
VVHILIYFFISYLLFFRMKKKHYNCMFQSSDECFEETKLSVFLMLVFESSDHFFVTCLLEQFEQNEKKESNFTTAIINPWWNTVMYAFYDTKYCSCWLDQICANNCRVLTALIVSKSNFYKSYIHSRAMKKS